MIATTMRAAVTTVTARYIEGAFVESHDHRN
jgi:hypothetical protein